MGAERIQETGLLGVEAQRSDWRVRKKTSSLQGLESCRRKNFQKEEGWAAPERPGRSEA